MNGYIGGRSGGAWRQKPASKCCYSPLNIIVTLSMSASFNNKIRFTSKVHDYL
jgi:hypothetical protein